MSTASLLARCPVCGYDLPAPFPGHCPRPACGVELAPGAPPRARTFRLAGHYNLFVLPFSFNGGDGPDPVRRLAESGRWRERLFSAADAADVDRTEYFLPYIRRFLFPSLYAPAGKVPPGETTCRHFEFDLARLGPAGEEVRATNGLPLLMRCRDARKKTSLENRLLLEKAELILFGFRVGFLVLRVSCADGAATYFDQMDVAGTLRTLQPLYQDFEMPQLECGAARYGVPQLLAFLLAEFAPAPAPGAGGGPEQLPAAPALPVRPAYDDRMMVYTFSCLDKQTCLEDAGRCQALLHRAAVIRFDEAPSRLPPSQQADEDSAGWLRARWEGFSKDGGSLVVFNTDAYHSRYAGVYHATYYFDVFLLAVLQRVTLLALYERLADIQGLTRSGAAGRRLLRRVRRDLLLFKNQCWFSQITNRERGLVLWKRWQRTLETRTLFKEVNEQSAELESYLQGRHRERTERLMKVGGFLAAAVPLVWGVDALFDRADWAKALRWGLLAALLLGSAVVGWYVFFRQEDA